MKYRIIRATVAAGKVCKVGDLVEVSHQEGKALMAYGKAVPHDETAFVDRVETVEVRETKPSGRGRKPNNGR